MCIQSRLLFGNCSQKVFPWLGAVARPHLGGSASAPELPLWDPKASKSFPRTPGQGDSSQEAASPPTHFSGTPKKEPKADLGPGRSLGLPNPIFFWGGAILKFPFLIVISALSPEWGWEEEWEDDSSWRDLLWCPRVPLEPEGIIPQGIPPQCHPCPKKATIPNF